MNPVESALDQWRGWNIPLRSKPQLVRALSGGADHATYLLATPSDTGENITRLVLKVRQSDHAFFSLAGLVDLSASVAPSVFYENDQVQVFEWVDRPSWQSPQHLQEIASSLQRVHRISAPTDTKAVDIHRICTQYMHDIEVWQGHRTRCLKALEAISKLEATVSAQCLCHNDLNPGNILVDARGAVFIDWDYAGLNHPEFDLASIIEFGHLSDRNQRQFLHAYGFTEESEQLLSALKPWRIAVRLLENLWWIQRRQCQQSSMDRLIALTQ